MCSLLVTGVKHAVQNAKVLSSVDMFYLLFVLKIHVVTLQVIQNMSGPHIQASSQSSSFLTSNINSEFLLLLLLMVVMMMMNVLMVNENCVVYICGSVSLCDRRMDGQMDGPLLIIARSTDPRERWELIDCIEWNRIKSFSFWQIAHHY